jgi:hypothetical protein
VFWDKLVKSFKAYNNSSSMSFVHFLEFKVFGCERYLAFCRSYEEKEGWSKQISKFSLILAGG